MPVFNSETARAAGKRGNQSRALIKQLQSVSRETPLIHAKNATLEAIARETLEQISVIDLRLHCCITKGHVKRVESLIQSKLALWRIYAHAAAVPQPGALKHKTQRTTTTLVTELRPSFDTQLPIPDTNTPLPDPDPKPASLPDTTTDTTTDSKESILP